jgi:hypothetical protein
MSSALAGLSTLELEAAPAAAESAGARAPSSSSADKAAGAKAASVDYCASRPVGGYNNADDLRAALLARAPLAGLAETAARSKAAGVDYHVRLSLGLAPAAAAAVLPPLMAANVAAFSGLDVTTCATHGSMMRICRANNQVGCRQRT